MRPDAAGYCMSRSGVGGWVGWGGAVGWSSAGLAAAGRGGPVWYGCCTAAAERNRAQVHVAREGPGRKSVLCTWCGQHAHTRWSLLLFLGPRPRRPRARPGSCLRPPPLSRPARARRRARQASGAAASTSGSGEGASGAPAHHHHHQLRTWEAAGLGAFAGLVAGLATSPIELSRLMREDAAARSREAAADAALSRASSAAALHVATTTSGQGPRPGLAPQRQLHTLQQQGGGGSVGAAAGGWLARAARHVGGLRGRLALTTFESMVFFPSLEASIRLCDWLEMSQMFQQEEAGAGMGAGAGGSGASGSGSGAAAEEGALHM